MFGGRGENGLSITEVTARSGQDPSGIRLGDELLAFDRKPEHRILAWSDFGNAR